MAKQKERRGKAVTETILGRAIGGISIRSGQKIGSKMSLFPKKA